MAVFKLSKPVKIDGQEKTEITYDLEALTGEDIQRITTKIQAEGIIISTVEFDINYHAAVFAEAAGLMYEDVKRFSAKDYNRISSVVRNFFLADMAELSTGTE